MGKITLPRPAKLIAGILISPEEIPKEVVFSKLSASFGNIDLATECRSFDETEYYSKEMGNTLLRCFVSFAKLVDPGELAAIKHISNNMEIAYLNAAGGRSVNIDPGLVSLENLILATTKNFTHRIYIGKGIYGDLTLIFQKGQFHPLPWTYPDYSNTESLAFIQKVRDVYREQLKGLNL